MLREHLQIRWACAELDRRLAEGADPHDDRLLELRAARLVSRSSRARVAIGLERVVATVEKPKFPLSAAVPVRRGPVRGARDDLLRLARALRHTPEARPCGVAMAERLVTDPCSPLYTAASSAEVRRAARAAADCMSAEPTLL
jgi:hypothetical protein